MTELERTLLQAELQNDPEGMGYAAAIAAGDWAAVQGKLLTGSAGSTKPRMLVTRGFFLLTIAASAFRISSLPDAGQRAWDRVLSMIQANESIDVSSPGVLGLLAMGVAQGVITEAEKLALTTEPCTRIEAIWGRIEAVPLNELQSLTTIEVPSVP